MLVAIGYGMVMHIPLAYSEEPVEWTLYWSANGHNLTTSQELSVAWGDILGITSSSNSLFNDLSYSGYCLWLVQPQKMKVDCLSKYMDADKDYFILESMSGEGWKSIYGTGKFKDMTGGGLSHDWLDNFQNPIRPGTSQGRVTLQGKIEFPKSE
jgi:hypothetical protein